MGRHRTIDRDIVLDAAESIVRTQGIAALTIDAVARGAGITKGGVQSSFGTKDQLIEAMYNRWGAQFDADVNARAGVNPDPITAIGAHIEVTYAADDAQGDRAASMMAALLNAPEHLQGSRDWYAERMAGLDFSTAEGRAARLAFLATEGTFMLRRFGFMTMSPAQWDDVFTDIRALLPESAPGK